MTTEINFNERDNGQSILFDGTASEVCKGCMSGLLVVGGAR